MCTKPIRSVVTAQHKYIRVGSAISFFLKNSGITKKNHVKLQYEFTINKRKSSSVCFALNATSILGSHATLSNRKLTGWLSDHNGPNVPQLHSATVV